MADSDPQAPSAGLVAGGFAAIALGALIATVVNHFWARTLPCSVRG